MVLGALVGGAIKGGLQIGKKAAYIRYTMPPPTPNKQKKQVKKEPAKEKSAWKKPEFKEADKEKELKAKNQHEDEPQK